MTKVLHFSQKYPDYHTLAGDPTFFVEKFLTFKVGNTWHEPWYEEKLMSLPENEGKQRLIPDFVKNLSKQERVQGKRHTVRGDYRWFPGSKFSPRVWSGVPYKSKTIAFWEDVTVEKVWEIVWHEDNPYPIINGKRIGLTALDFLATNDGLTILSFIQWFTDNPTFKKSGRFTGIINCWDPNLSYE